MRDAFNALNINFKHFILLSFTRINISENQLAKEVISQIAHDSNLLKN